MFQKERDVLQKISEKLSTDRRILKAIAYGSRIRGDYRGDSDLDVLVIVDKKDREIKEEILNFFYSYELETDISFSVVIFSLEELEINERLGSPFIKNIKREGLTIYDSTGRGKKDAFKISSRKGRKTA